ncbi:MAG: class I SAM-dependent methyltransferase [Syntrophomonadaceae bacterium]|nr:class I SAM-dependent methyltransferase [Syntrophomonadaceae bacterium]
MKSEIEITGIRSKPAPYCFICGSPGDNLYEDLSDRFYGAPGLWGFKRCANSECGLVWLDPKPLDEDIGKAYQKYYTHIMPMLPETLLRRLFKCARNDYLAKKYVYQRKSNWKEFLAGKMLYLYPGKREDADISVMCLPAHPGGQLLEVGCGSGIMLSFMRDLGWTVRGVDFDPLAVESAERKGLQVDLGTVEAQGYPDNCFDVITMCHLIEHDADPFSLLCECYRIMKPGGRLVIVTPNNDSWGHKVFKENWFALDPPRHIYIFSTRNLMTITSQAGFKPVYLTTYVRLASEIFSISKRIETYNTTGRELKNKQIVKFGGGVFKLFEWLRLKFNKQVGEEIVFIATK